ncbi:hypothetical protein LINPERPRIM_LOCUS83 [Linum perenne]
MQRGHHSEEDGAGGEERRLGGATVTETARRRPGATARWREGLGRRRDAGVVMASAEGLRGAEAKVHKWRCGK